MESVSLLHVAATKFTAVLYLGTATDAKKDSHKTKLRVITRMRHVRVDRLFQQRRRPICPRQQLSAVVLQIGSNDLANDHCTVEQSLTTLTNYVRCIQSTLGVRRVVIMEILHRQPARRQRMNLTLAEFNEKVYTANTRMKDLCSTTPNVEFWQHPEQLRRPGVICADGVHLNDRHEEVLAECPGRRTTCCKDGVIDCIVSNSKTVDAVSALCADSEIVHSSSADWLLQTSSAFRF